MAGVVAKIIQNPFRLFCYLAQYGCFNWLNDELYLKLYFRGALGHKLNLTSPKTYNEKLQWLKLYDRNEKYIDLVDKHEVKKYVADVIGEESIIPTLGVWDKFEDIDFTKLPSQFVLKCTHDSGGVVICKNKDEMDMQAARKTINKALRKNFYWFGREWPYKNIQPRIIAEKYIGDESGCIPADYKFFCFDGEAKLMFIATERYSDKEETKFDFYDMNFSHLPLINGHPNSNERIECPSKFEEMKKLACDLSAGIPHVRVDFYEVGGKIYFGEFTFSHWSGMVPFEPYEYDEILGSWITLPRWNQNLSINSRNFGFA